MEFTGERYVPEVAGQIRAEHLHRYALASHVVDRRDVLDVASGEGYGAALLAERAASVIGVDIDPATIAHAREQYAGVGNLSFAVGSCDAIPLPGGAVDVVTSFETIEHHDKHREMMSEIKRVLRRDGTLVISSPNRSIYSDRHGYRNPFHVRELYYDELVALLKDFFRFVVVYGQRYTPGSFVFKLDEASGRPLGAYVVADESLSRGYGRLDDPVYFIAVCSDEVENTRAGEFDSVMVDKGEDTTQELRDECTHLHAQLKEAQTVITNLQGEVDLQQGIVASMKSSKFWKLRDHVLRVKNFAST